MTRLYIQPSFVNSCEEHGLWSGGNDQYRGDRSVDLATFDKNGRARVEAFSDDAVARLKEKKTSIPLADRILPQAKRVRTLTEQLIELEKERKAGMDIAQYSQLRDILIAKRDRAEVLLKQAMAKKPVRNTQEEEEAHLHTQQSNASFQPEFVQEKGQNSVKNSVGKASNSALKDAIVFLSWSAVLLIGFKVFF